MEPKDIYADQKAATPEELLEVVKYHYLYGPASHTDSEGRSLVDPEHMMDMAFKIGRGEGWTEIAPAWLREYRARKLFLEEKEKNKTMKTLIRPLGDPEFCKEMEVVTAYENPAKSKENGIK